MRNKACCRRLNIRAWRIVVLLGIAVCVAIGFTGATMRAASESVIHSFAGQPSDGAYPYSGLTLGPDGSLYGTTVNGGMYGSGTDSGYGTVYKLTPSASGWSETVLHNFQDNPDGAHPYGGVIFGPDGALYGTTAGGGDYYVGTVFKLTPNGTGWSETVLYSFRGSPDGMYPYAGVVFGPDGALYGTTYYGGASGGCLPNGCGTVFRLSPNAPSWSETVLHSFQDSPDGANPYAGVMFGAGGALYGTTVYGGASNLGTVYSLSQQGGSDTVLHSFSGPDGANPYAGVIFDLLSTLYGTTYSGGAYGYGTVFQLHPTRAGSWPETVLHSFQNSPDGANPYAGVIFGRDGALYGTTYQGGSGTYAVGTVFKLSPASRGANWPETVLYSFQAKPDGANPFAGVIFGSDGALYGTTVYGGTSNNGTAYRVGP